MILLDEEIVGKQLDKNGIISNRFALKEGIVLIKYYKYLGLSTEEIKNNLHEKIHIQNDFNNSISEYIYNILILNMNHIGEFKNSPITIYKEEIDMINTLETDMLRRIMYIILVYCKSFKNALKIKKTELMKLAGLRTNTDIIDKNIKKLIDANYISIDIMKYKLKNKNKFTVYYSLTNKWDFEKNTILFTIEKTNNPIIYYDSMLTGEKIKECEICKENFLLKKRSMRKKQICDKCYKIYRSKLRHREYRNKNIN